MLDTEHEISENIFIVATDMGLELPNKRNKVCAMKERLAPSCGLQDRANLHSPWTASTHQPVTQVTPKPAQQFSPEGP